MVRKAILTLTLTFGLFSAPPSLGAQVKGATPILRSPATQPGWGFYGMVPMGGNFGAMVLWSGEIQGRTQVFRIGFAEDFYEDPSAFVGFDLGNPLVEADNGFPLDVLWSAGWGLGANLTGGGHADLSFSLGLSVGREFGSDGLRLVPYVAPQAAIDIHVGEPVYLPVVEPGRKTGLEGTNTNRELGVALELGIDIAIDSTWAIRVGGALFHYNSIVAGIVFHGL